MRRYAFGPDKVVANPFNKLNPNRRHEPLFSLHEVADRLGRDHNKLRWLATVSDAPRPVLPQTASHPNYYSLRQWREFMARFDRGEVPIRAAPGRPKKGATHVEH